MADSWEDEFETSTSNKAPMVKASWEDDVESSGGNGNIKASWEDEEEEILAKASAPVAAVSSGVSGKKKRTVAQAIKERQLSNDQIQKQPKSDDDVESEETEAERKLRLLKLQKEADLENAEDLFSVCDRSSSKEKVSSIDVATFKPKNAIEYENLSKALFQQFLSTHSNNGKLYPGFVEALMRELVAPLNYDAVRSLSSTINVIANEKQKAGKGKKKTVQKKAVLKAEFSEMDAFGGGGAGESGKYDDFDDFM